MDPNAGFFRSAVSDSDSSAEEQWKPTLHSISPYNVASVGGQRLTLEGNQLIPPGVDIVQGEFLKIYLVKLNEPNQGTSLECDMKSFVITAHDNSLQCTTPDDMETGKYDVKVSMYDANFNHGVGGMRWIDQINPHSGYGNCKSHYRKCRVNSYNESSGPKTRLYGNRVINGKSDDTSFYWTEWLSVSNNETILSTGEEREYYLRNYHNNMRPHMCDYPIKHEVRRVSDQVMLEDIPDVEVKNQQIWGNLQKQDNSNKFGQNSTKYRNSRQNPKNSRK